MTTNNTKADTIDFNRARLVSTLNDLGRQASQGDDILSRLSRRLQTTLDIRAIVNIFAEEVRNLVNFEQFDYCCESIGYYLTREKRLAHSCNYRLKLDNEDLGEIHITRSKKFVEEELAIIERVMSSLVFPLRNALLYRQALEAALQDPLTALGNKRALDAALHREAEMSRRHNIPLSIIVVDVDHFKNINDTWGHCAGDVILKQMADCLKASSRKSDQCFRFGGEEFVVVLSNTNAAGARIISERLRRNIETSRHFMGDTEVPVTASLGTATFNYKETLSHFMERADRALYKAKQNGRNRVMSAEVREKHLVAASNKQA